MRETNGSPVMVSVNKLRGQDNPGFEPPDHVPGAHQPHNLAPNGNQVTKRTLPATSTSSVYVTSQSADLDLGSTRTGSIPSTRDSVQMTRSINLLYMTAMMIAVTGHVSIFLSPAAILNEAGSVGGALVVWLVGGVINLGTALCFAELGTMMPKAGGPYAYVSKAFGPVVGFLIMWGYTVLLAGPFWAYLSYTAALYVVRPVVGDCTLDDVTLAVNLIAGWLMGK